MQSNLPRQTSSFVGRARELAELARLLADAPARLVTLVGPAGSGKTRLAVEVAVAAADAFADGAVFVGLESLLDPALIDAAAAAALSLRIGSSRQAADAVVDALRQRTMLLLLDNCEHLRPGCAALVQRLRAECPGVQILATSRAPLVAEAEIVFPVEPLDLPIDSQPDSLLRSSAGRLFVERANAAAAGFEATEKNAAAVAAICRRLDGLPLAIELAAARTRLLSVQQIEARLDQRFRLLAGGHAASDRHRTLAAAIDWSYRLLDPAEQTLFRSLSVFAGGFTLEAAEAVAAAAPVTDAYAADLLERLVDGSLVVADREAGDVRFRLLESLRVFARERLHEEEATAAEGTQARFYRTLAGTAAPLITGPDQQAWLNRLATEHDNLRAAFAWFVAAGDAASAVQMAGELWRFWYVRGHLGEGRRQIETALTLPGAVTPSARALALQGLGLLAKEEADFVVATASLEAALVLRRDAGEPRGIAAALNNLANVQFEQVRYGEARALYAECLEVYRREHDLQGTALVLNNLAQVLTPQERATARTLYQESLGICRGLNDLEHMVPPLNNLGLDAFASGEFTEARAYYGEALEICRAIGYRYGVALLLANLGHVARALGQGAEARSLQQQSLAQAEETGHTGAVVHALRSLAALAVDAQDWPMAATLFGAGEANGQAAAVPIAPPYAAEHAAALDALAAAPDQPALRLARLHGATLTLDAAAKLARSELNAEPAASTPLAGTYSEAPSERPRAAQPSSRELDVLTRRELEVLRLVVAGRSNKEAARALTLSVRTVEHHVASIYAKFGVHTRGGVIGAALRAGLGNRGQAPPDVRSNRIG